MGYPTEYFTVLFALGPDAGLAGPVGRDAAGQGSEDRPAAADLHRRGRAAVRADREALSRMTDQIDTLLSEKRRFPTTAGFAARAAATTALYAAGHDWERFWEDQAAALDWMSPWTRVLDWKPPHAKWFVGGKLNVSVNCLDRHLRGPRRNKAAHHLGRRARRPAGAHLLGPRPGGRPRAPTRSSGLGVKQGRPGGDLPADGARGGDRHAGLRPDRRGALGRVRRLLRRGAARPDQRRRGGRAHHRRRRLSPRPGRAAQADGRRRRWPRRPRSSTCIVVRRRPAARATRRSPR